jgi:NADH-quinone oxidoreductase subunit J
LKEYHDPGFRPVHLARSGFSGLGHRHALSAQPGLFGCVPDLEFQCDCGLLPAAERSVIAVAQIAVYAGAIMVLFLFVIMLLGAEETPVKCA